MKPVFVRLATFRDRVWADMAADVLREHDVPVLLQAPSASGLFSTALHDPLRAVHLLVPDTEVDEARTLIAHLLDSDPENPP